MDAPIKFFTPAEANKTLPLVKRIACDILETGRELAKLQAEMGNAAEKNPRFAEWADRFDDLMDEIEALGCFYKDWNFEMGLVDFPSRVEGKDVFLCWRTDEPCVQYYHDLEAGFPGRQPIPSQYLEPIEKEARK